MKKTNVLFLIPSLISRGSERMLVNLVNQLGRDEFSNYVVSLSNNNPLAEQIQPKAATFTALPRKWRYDLQPALQIRKIISKNQINTIVGFDLFSYFYIWYAMWGIRRKPRIFISIHNVHFRNWKYLFQNLMYARLLSGDEKFISVCNAQAEYWAKTYWIPRKCFVTVYNGVDTEFFRPPNDLNQKRKFRAILNLPDDAFVILQVASLTSEKRHEDSLSAFKYLLDQEGYKSHYLVFVGHGSENRKKQLRNMAYQLGITERVIFYDAQDDVRPFYIAADMFTLTSKNEAFSLAALEAMSTGLPCVLTDIGGAREMIAEGINGYLVKSQAPISIAKGWAAVFMKNAHFDHEKIRTEVIERFSLTSCVHQYKHLFISAE